MFVMMNAALRCVQGIVIAEHFIRRRLGYAKDRVQNRRRRQPERGLAIIHHPDVKRMLMTMQHAHRGTWICWPRWPRRL
jgi:butyryl-CoA dehydrogenase